MGDKGANITKFGSFLPVCPANSPYNFTVFSIYKGDDNRADLENKLRIVIDQLKVLKSICNLTIEWYQIYFNITIFVIF